MASNKMTKEDATNFDSISPMNAMMATIGKECDCQPYIDIFTFARWKAQGFHVRKGEHGNHISTFKKVEKVNSKGETKTFSFPKTTVVFCRCQVDKDDETVAATVIDDGEFLNF